MFVASEHQCRLEDYLCWPAGSSAAVAYRLDQLPQGLCKALEPFIFGTVPFVVLRCFVCSDIDAAHIAADGAARNLSHALSVAYGA